MIEIAGPFRRIHLSEHPALHFGREAKSRFDDPDGLLGGTHKNRMELSIELDMTYHAFVLPSTTEQKLLRWYRQFRC